MDKKTFGIIIDVVLIVILVLFNIHLISSYNLTAEDVLYIVTLDVSATVILLLRYLKRRMK